MVCQNSPLDSLGESDIETLDVETAPLTAQAFKRYRGKMRLLDNIHSAIASKVQALRDAREYVFRDKDNRQLHLPKEIAEQSAS